MIDCLNVARYFIIRAYEDGIEAEMTNMKVQKLLYSEFEAKQLPIPDKESLLQLPREKKELLEEIWEYFGGYHAYKLSDMTHLEFPWKKARKGLPPQASSTEPIQLNDMKELGYQKLDRIERDHPEYELAMSEILHDAFASESLNRIGKGEVHDWLNSLLD
jgi:uncharacterized phage-associated protein